MGALSLLGVPLGPVESLALAVIVGVSVDYLVHLAFAYSNALAEERYYKSRAAFMARASSITSAGLTTLCAVLPLLASKLLPLREFGAIFVVVALVSYAFAMLFFQPLMMLAGPRRTRRAGTQRPPNAVVVTATAGVELQPPTEVREGGDVPSTGEPETRA
eukprot:3028038-Prymnesium_polylepis.1